MPFTPYIIYGTATDKNGNPIANTSITLLNNGNNETITTTTNALGQYAFDLANLPTGWYNGTSISVYTAAPTFEFYASHDEGNNWNQVDNFKTYTLSINTIRVKIDLTNHPAGRNVNITKNA